MSLKQNEPRMPRATIPKDNEVKQVIAIINDGSNLKATGVHGYRVQINYDKICEFTHLREDGLAVCLARAALAVAESDAKEKALLDAFNKLGS